MKSNFIKATIITIGDELMIGQVIDTNSAWIAEALNTIGIGLYRRVAIGDDRMEILKTLKEESALAPTIIITGGLGPTADDITKPVLSEYFGGEMIVNQEVLKHLENMFRDIFKKPFTERNAMQALLPSACKVLMNNYGTAPGMQFEKDGAIFFSLPGVPYEMQGLMQEHVLPLLKLRFPGKLIIHRTLITIGIGESYLADHIQKFEESLPANIKIAYLPGNGLLRLRLTARGQEGSDTALILEKKMHELSHLCGEWVISEKDLSLPQIVLKMMNERDLTLATAESCTGGYIAHLLTSEAGSSSVYKGSIISYANEVKKDLLGVTAEMLSTEGAVSEITVTQMAEAARRTLKTNYALSVSGIMGPDGGSEKKPVGTVWIAVASEQQTVARQFHFRYNRMQNIRMTANAALNELRKLIIQEIN